MQPSGICAVGPAPLWYRRVAALLLVDGSTAAAWAACQHGCYNPNRAAKSHSGQLSCNVMSTMMDAACWRGSGRRMCTVAI